MLTAQPAKNPVIGVSKINHKSPRLHPLARFVTEETVSLMFNLPLEDIYRIDCWRFVIYVHGKRVSRFVSYADFPPIIEVNPPTQQDISKWRRRWRKSAKSKYPSQFWTEFYRYQFQSADSAQNLLEWGQLLVGIKPIFSDIALQQLMDIYKKEKDLRMDNEKSVIIHYPLFIKD